MEPISDDSVQPQSSIELPPPVDDDTLFQQEQTYFISLVNDTDAGQYAPLELEANHISGLLPDERFYLRYAGKNFDGEDVYRWIFIAWKPPLRSKPGRYCLVLAAEELGTHLPMEPNQLHLAALELAVIDWRGGREAVLVRLKRQREQMRQLVEQEAKNTVRERLGEVFGYWQRIFDHHIPYGARGLGPNGGTKYFGTEAR